MKIPKTSKAYRELCQRLLFLLQSSDPVTRRATRTVINALYKQEQKNVKAKQAEFGGAE